MTSTAEIRTCPHCGKKNRVPAAASVPPIPCSGRSMETTANPASAKPSAIPTASSRLRVRPCWKMTTGQPPGGFAAPALLAALGTVANTGIEIVSVATGTGLKRVSNLLVASSAEGPPSHVAVSGAVGFACVGREL